MAEGIGRILTETIENNHILFRNVIFQESMLSEL